MKRHDGTWPKEFEDQIERKRVEALRRIDRIPIAVLI